MTAGSFARPLLAWFDRHQRDLPWRHNRDPYRIWVSEVMLQQTTVAAVVPYFQRFLQRFPDLADLAAADEHDVLRLWEGLGYYRRARHLHAAARQLQRDFPAGLPDDPAVWADLPGVGRYILGAVLSQAFDRRLPIVEANTKRVLCRLFARRGDPTSTDVQKWLWATAEAILPRKRVGDFNQALMELGALICTPDRPKCGDCPLARRCAAKRLGVQAEIPERPVAPTLTDVAEVAVVVRRGADVLLCRRPDDAGRWAGMWEFPRGELLAGEAVDDAARRLLPALTGVRAKIGGELLVVRHGVTRIRITLTGLEAKYTRGTFRPGAYAAAVWLPPAKLADYAVSMPQRKLAKVVQSGPRPLFE